VIPSFSTSIITIAFKESLNSKETLLMTWNTEKNEEISNISTFLNYFVIMGKNTTTGFLMMGQNYCNLDVCLTNFFFETKFIFTQDRHRAYIGKRINHNEDIVLLNGERILKETYVEIETVMIYKRNIDCINSNNIIID